MKNAPFAVAPNAASQCCLADVLERPRLEALGGGVDEQVEAAELGRGALDERARGRGVGEVAVGAAGAETPGRRRGGAARRRPCRRGRCRR